MGLQLEQTVGQHGRQILQAHVRAKIDGKSVAGAVLSGRSSAALPKTTATAISNTVSPDRATDALGGDSAQPRLQSAAPAPAAATPAPAVLSAEEVTRKLEQLRDLKERGLISKPLCREKVRELVDRYLK